MLRRIFAAILILMASLIMNACDSSKSTDTINARKLCNFQKIFSNVDVGIYKRDDIFVDLNTNVIYYRNWTRGFTPIYNADGSLKLWEGEVPK